MARPAMIATGRNRLVLGKDLRVVEVGHDQIWLEGVVRLRPGQSIDLVGAWPGLDEGAARGRVVTWRIVRLSSEGPHYRGCCRIEP
jgi:hypothetical protein